MSNQVKGAASDLTQINVPLYDDGGQEDKDHSLRDMLLSMKVYFKKIGTKVDSFGKQLHKTQDNKTQMATRFDEAMNEQETFQGFMKEESVQTKQES